MSANHNTNRFICIDTVQLEKMASQYQQIYEALDYERRMAKGRDTFYASLIIAILGIVLLMPQIANLINS